MSNLDDLYNLLFVLKEPIVINKNPKNSILDLMTSDNNVVIRDEHMAAYNSLMS